MGGRPEVSDISWPSSPVGTARRGSGEGEAEEEEGGGEEKKKKDRVSYLFNVFFFCLMREECKTCIKSRNCRDPKARLGSRLVIFKTSKTCSQSMPYIRHS